MNFKITPEKLEKIEKSIYTILDNFIDLNDVAMTNPWVNDWDNKEEYEDFYMKFYYLGNWYGEDDTDILFTYFHPEYYDSNSPSEKSLREKAPILEINNESLVNRLEIFGHKLYFPVISKWFEDKFNLPVKSVTAYF